MSKLGLFVRRFLIQAPEFEPDYPLDHLIRAALLEDSLARPSTGAWERLRRQALIEQQYRRSGMWLLDEPLRDPPEVTPLQLDKHDYKRAMHLYADQTTVTSCREIMLYKNSLWGGMMPSFAGLMNW